MTTQAPPRTRPRMGSRIHRAWFVAAVTLGALVAAAAFRSSTGALFEPLEAEFGWSRAITSGAVTLNLVIYGLTAPFAAALMERFGIRRVVAIALAVVGVASALTTFMTAAWQLWLLWGVAIGRRHRVHGAGLRRHRGQPLVREPPRAGHRHLLRGQRHRAARLSPGHRRARGGTGLARRGAGRDRRHGRPGAAGAVGPGRQPRRGGPQAVRRGAGSRARAGARRAPCPPCPPCHGPANSPRTPGTSSLRPGWRSGHWSRARARSVFWILVGTFWICGWSTNGLIQTHLIPAAHDHGMPPGTAAGLLAVIGVVRHRRHGRLRLADRPDRPARAAVRLLLVPRDVPAGGAVAARAGGRAAAVGVHRLLRAGLGRHRPADGRPVPAPTSAWSAPASSSAGCSPRTWSAPAWRRASPAGSVSPAATTSARG